MADNISSIEKAIKVLKRLSEEPYKMTALELSDELNINRSTVHRILNTLMDEMLILQSPESKKYTLGPGAYYIGSSYLSRDSSAEQIKHILEWVAKETKQSIGYSILEGEKIINIYEIESFQPVKIGYRAGSYYPIHCGVYGKCIMAYFEPISRLEEIVYSYDLYKRTPYTITDPKELLKEYEKIRLNGYAISDEEGLLGAIGIGAPVRNSKGKVVACVGSASIKSSLDEKDLEVIKEKVIEGAKRISKIIL